MSQLDPNFIDGESHVLNKIKSRLSVLTPKLAADVRALLAQQTGGVE